MSNVYLDGDSKGLQRAVQQAVKQYEKANKTLQGTSRESKKAAREAQRIKESISPWERFARQIGRVTELRKKDLLTERQAHNARMKYFREMNAAQNRLRPGGFFGGPMGDLGGKVGAAMNTQIASMIGGWVGLANVVREVGAAFSDVNQRIRESVQLNNQAFGQLGELQQVSSNAGQFVRQTREVADLIRTGTFLPEQLLQAGRLRFAATSAGINPADLFVFQHLARTGAVTSQNLPSLMSATARAGGPGADPVRTLSAGLAGAAPVQTDLTTFLRMMAGMRPAILSGVISERESIALLSTLMGTYGPEEARTRATRLTEEIDLRPELQGRNFADTLRNIQQRVAAGEQLSDVIGNNKRVMQGYRLAVNELDTTFQSVLGTVDRFIGRIEILNRDFSESEPIQRAIRAFREGTGERATRERLLFDEKQTLVDAYMQSIMMAPGGRIQRQVLLRRAQLFDFLGADDALLRMAQDRGQQGGLMNAGMGVPLSERLDAAITARRAGGGAYGAEEYRFAAELLGGAIGYIADRLYDKAPAPPVGTPE